jgi:hypothetical protein
MNDTIKIGFCVAYDWYLLEYALPLVYHDADKICLSLDKDRISWSGHQYSFDEKLFRKMISEIDSLNKIFIVEENYHLAELTPMQNEVRQRNEIAQHLGVGGWHIQLDCDEYFIEFGAFVNYLRELPVSRTKRSNVCCAWLVIFKQVRDGFLCINPIENEKLEYMQIATREPHYEYGRRNGDFNIYTNFKLIHQSWARSEEEIKEKIYNWGHSNDFEKEKYLNFWKSLDESNFFIAKNFHWLKPEAWPSLKLIKAYSIRELISNHELINFPSFSKRDLYFKNSRFLSRLRKLVRIFFKTNT